MPFMEKPCAPACEKNRKPILEVLRDHFGDRRAVLEIGSGTGQHAIFFAARLPHLIWQTSDRAENLPGIKAWLDETGLANTPPALELDVTGAWPARRYDAVFSANTLHIMDWRMVEGFFRGVGRLLAGGGTLAVYGPFRYGGRFTSDSNAAFDRMLRERDAASGIRDFEAVDALAAEAGLAFQRDFIMPVNNQLLVWRVD